MRRSRYECDVRIAGIPCSVRAHLDPGDPSVGIFGPYVDDLELLSVGGRRVKKQSHYNWLWKKLDDDAVWQRVCEDIMEKVNE